MKAVDYFLFDNRTSSVRFGSDWDVKRETGPLAQRRDLYKLFHSYGTATHGDPKHPANFREAVGGIRPLEGDGYLLCVTLEAPDAINRPSFAVVGLWCPDRATLEDLVWDGDPVASARTVLLQDPPRSALEILPRSGPSRPCPLRAPEGTTVLRFEPRESVRVALALLQGVSSGETVPSILGITASPSLGDIVRRRQFSVIFGKPMDERTEQVLKTVERPAGVLIARERPIVVIPPSPSSPAQSDDMPPLEKADLPPVPSAGKGGGRPVAPVAQLPESTARWQWWSVRLEMAAIGALSGVIFGALTFALLVLWHGRPPVVSTSPVDAPPVGAVQPGATPDAPLDSVRAALDDLRKLDPERLKDSPGFITADTIAVAPQHEEDRSRVRRAYSTLIDRRNTLLDSKWIEDVKYLYDIGKGGPAGERQRSLTQQFAVASVARECGLLEGAFGAEMSSTDSVAATWCRTFQSLEQRLQTIDIDGRNPRESNH